MKKILAIVLSFCFVLKIFSQTNASVNLDDDVYKLLDYAQLKGYIARLPYQKPYSNEQIKKSLYEILNDNDELSDYERSLFSDAVLKIENLNKKDETKKNNLLHSRVSNIDEEKNQPEFFSDDADVYNSSGEKSKPNIPVTFVYDLSLETIFSGGLYSKTDYSQFGLEIMPDLNFAGDFSKYLSWNFNALGAIIRMPLIELGDYYCGTNWYTGKDKDRTIKKFINASYLPYNYKRKWDAKVYYLTNLSTTGLEGWPQELSLALNMTGEIRAAFFDNKLNLGFGRIFREVAGMDFGSSLVLNSNARPFAAFEMQASPFDFLRYSFIVGSLEYPSQSYLNKNWYPDESDNDDSYYFQNNYTINMVDLEFKYLHIDFGSAVIWPNRFAFGYMFPLANFVEYQNHLGDADNLQMFGDVKLKYPGLGEIWASLFLDELDLSTLIKKDVFTYTRDMFAYQVGLKYVIPKLPFATLSLRYTKIEPYCYTHQAINYTPWFNHYISQNYTNDGYGLGYYLDPNSDELRLDFNVIPMQNLNCRFTYQFIRHGADYGSQQVPGSSLYSELNPSGRSAFRKYFLHDGAYNWLHIINIGGDYTTKTKYPVTFSADLGLLFSFYTMINSENYTTDGNAENCDFSTSFFVVNNDEYPRVFGTVLTLGVKVTF